MIERTIKVEKVDGASEIIAKILKISSDVGHMSVTHLINQVAQGG